MADDELVKLHPHFQKLIDRVQAIKCSASEIAKHVQGLNHELEHYIEPGSDSDEPGSDSDETDSEVDETESEMEETESEAYGTESEMEMAGTAKYLERSGPGMEMTAAATDVDEEGSDLS
jgi:predicted RNase H-like nuclease (RuvC/YqgF family)